jgi:hypothetical protein
VSMRPPQTPAPAPKPRRRIAAYVLRSSLAGLAGLAAALLVACGSSGKALIPVAHAGPLLSDFEAVRNAAENANGECSATEAAVSKTEEDFDALPSTVDAGLRDTLHQGIVNLRKRAHEMCIQPVGQSTGTTATTEKSTTTTTTPTTTTTETQPTTSTPITPPEETEEHGPGGGTPAPGETPGGEQGGGVGAGEGNQAGGVGAGEGGK